MENAIEIRNLSKRYEGFELKNINLIVNHLIDSREGQKGCYIFRMQEYEK